VNIDYLLVLQLLSSRGSLDEASQAEGFPIQAFGNDDTFILQALQSHRTKIEPCPITVRENNHYENNFESRRNAREYL